MTTSNPTPTEVVSKEGDLLLVAEAVVDVLSPATVTKGPGLVQAFAVPLVLRTYCTADDHAAVVNVLDGLPAAIRVDFPKAIQQLFQALLEHNAAGFLKAALASAEKTLDDAEAAARPRLRLVTEDESVGAENCPPLEGGPDVFTAPGFPEREEILSDACEDDVAVPEREGAL